VDGTRYLHPAQVLEQDLIRWRRDFHQHPELAFNEHRSAGIIEEHLRSLGFDVESGIASTGLAASLEGRTGGSKLMLRFDMDALPIEEAKDRPYASLNQGVMHACGHDGHMAIGMGVAQILASQQDELPGKITLVFQPAEEGGGGAQRMLEAGILDRLRPDAAVALHVWNELPLGTFAVAPGPVMAGADRFLITLHGRGGHAALPNNAIDPIPAAAALIQAYQTIPSRNLDPRETLVLSVTRVEGGRTFNVIPDSVELEGTLRYFSQKVRERAVDRMRVLSDATGSAYGCSVEFEFENVAPPVVNNEGIASVITAFTEDVFPSNGCLDDYRSMVSEDMGFFLDRVPGCYLFLGSSNPDRGLNASHHNPSFDFDERALVIGTAWLVGIVERLLGKTA